ncbi:MAG: hypothetical protein PVF58_06350 [Candidatus Methanofastidiosia archaeon]|jgi:hypothetical protein
MAKYTKESVYEEILESGSKGKRLTSEKKMPYLNELLEEGKIKKVRYNYYIPEFAPTTEKVYQKVKDAGKKGVSLNITERELIKPLVKEGKVKTAYRPPKYFLRKHAPLYKKEVVERLLDKGYLKKIKSRYIFVRDLEEPGKMEPKKVPSLFEFLKTLQKIYLRRGKGYQESVRIIPLIEELTSEMDISRATVEEWILELPRMFIGVVGLRQFPNEPGLELEDGRKISRIYLEREIVGL